MGSNPTILVLTIISIFGIFGFNLAGVTVTKKINALARAIANMTKSIFVWILGLIVTLSFGSVYPNLKWEKLDALVIIFQIIGFIFMAFGNFVYNDVLKLPFLK